MNQKRLGISVEDALKLDAFAGVRVVAGQDGLRRKILHVNVMEVPDIANWVREGELLFTTLYSLRDEPRKQIRLIEDLAARNLAGIAIKPKRFIEAIPPELIAKANSLNFPLLSIPPEASFAEMIEPLLNEIFAFQTELLHQSELIHTKLLNVVLKGGALADVVDTLQELVKCSVFILDPNLGTLAPVGKEVPNLANLEDFSGVSFASQSQIIKSVIAAGRHLGFIVAVEKEGGFTVLDEITLERAATIAALEILNQTTLHEVERRYRNEFVVGLLAGTFFSEQAARQRAKNNGWELHDQMRVVVFRIRTDPSASQKDQLFRYFGSNFGEGAIFGEVGQDIVLVIPSNASCYEVLNSLISHLGQITRIVHSPVVVGIGRDTKSIRSIPESFRQANIAVRLGRRLPSLGPIIHYDQLGIFRLLNDLPSQEIEGYVSDILQPLLDYEKKNHLDLVNTLEQYFAAGGNISQVAKNMFVHYNTVVYRLERVDKLLGLQLANPEDRLNIEMALKAKEYLESGE